MQKRLKEIVIYILENGNSLEPEQRAELEAMRGELVESGLSVEMIEEAIRQVLELGSVRPPRPRPAAGSEPVSARHYLQRLVSLGLIDEEQRDEILQRARRLEPESPGLSTVEFLAASVIFDESLGFLWGWDGEIHSPAHNLH
jgi:uncharacterized protein Smg (DUF494 family)